MPRRSALRNTMGPCDVASAVCWSPTSPTLHGKLRPCLYPLEGRACEPPTEPVGLMTSSLGAQIGEHLEAPARCRERLLDVGVEAPSLGGCRACSPAQAGVPKHGWQFVATKKVEDCFLSGAMWSRDSSRALLRSQGGHMAGLPFTCVPRGAFLFRFPTVPCSSLASSLAPMALFCSKLPVWPFHSILVAITVQLAQRQVFRGGGASQSKARQHVCAAELEPGSR